MKSRNISALFPALLIVLLAGSAPTPRAAEGAAKPLRTYSRYPYVHRVTLYDEAGVAISPDDPEPRPYSVAMTCGKCHSIDDVNKGWHFNAHAGQAPAGRPGEPWIWVDYRTGTQLPLSYRGWPGVHDPRRVGINEWDFVKRFGRHLNGAGVGLGAPADPAQPRWHVSGALENDCMTCHSADPANDQAQRAAQIDDENFKWVPTVTEGLAVVRGKAADLPDDFDPDMPPDPNQVGGGVPVIEYDRGRFDANQRVFFNITRAPSEERCYFCHETRLLGPKLVPGSHPDGDVHVKAGLSCVDCHRHGGDHAMIRGYEGEAALTGKPEAITLSCRGCHYGEDEQTAARLIDKPTTATSFAAPSMLGLAIRGRNGSPRPRHEGIPAIHFEKLTCTACHSGPLPTAEAQPMYTAMAHGLGVPSRDRAKTDLPQIASPVYARDEQGRVGVFEVFWPAYWGRLRAGAVEPLTIRELDARVAPALALGKVDAKNFKPLSGEQILAALRAIAAADDAQSTAGPPVYLANGLLHRVDGQGLKSEPHPAAEPLRWALAHDVRPAQQALGARGCTDCHEESAPFYHGVAVVRGPATPGAEARVSMAELRGDDPHLIGAWEQAVRFRPIFKILGLAACGLLGLTLVGFGGYGLRSLGARIARRGGR